MLKRAQFYYRNPSPVAEETKEFLEENGVILKIRDIAKKPLTEIELDNLLGYHDPKHYLDTNSSAYRKHKLDASTPKRGELIKLIAEEPELIKHPIIIFGRLMTFGTGRRQLIEMFQIPVSGNGHDGNRHGNAGTNK